MMSDADAKSPEEAPAKYVPKPDGADPFATRLVRELKHDRGILACRYDSTGRFLFAGARDYLVHRWDLELQSPEPEPAAETPPKPKKPVVPVAPAEARTTMSAHESWVRGMSFFPAGDRLATGDFVGKLAVWSSLTGAPQLDFFVDAHKGSIREVSVSPDGKLIATAGNDHAVRLWQAHNGALQQELSGHDCHVYHVAFHPDGKSLVSADLKGRAKHWDLATGKMVRELDASLLYVYSVKYEVDVGGIRGMSFNADGSQLCCAGATGDKGIAHSGNARVLLLDWDSGKLLKELKPEKEEICTAWGVRFHPDGFIIGSGGSRTGGFLWFWTPEDEVAFHTVNFQQRAPGFDVDLAPDQKTLAVANHDGTVRLYAMAPEPSASEDVNA